MLDPAGAVAGRVFAFRDISRERLVEEMKSDFVNAVSHELRTPLTSIYGFAETLLRGELGFDETERETFLRYIGSESERLIRIVDDLLSVARLEAGTLAVALAPTDVGEVARDGRGGGREQSGGLHRFAVEVEPAELAVWADREKLGQVLANLLSNAIRYSPEGGTITVAGAQPRRRRRDHRERRGDGHPPTDHQRIFSKFFRAERVLSAQGTGLGLFLVRGLVTAMGGRIWVDSEEGSGSRFTFELPLADRRPAQALELEAAT